MVVKKTTTKAAATKKTTAKKTTAAKPAAKSTTAKTTTAKKTTTASKPATSTTEMSVTGNKKILSLQKEFNKKFPYLQLCIYYSYVRGQVAKGESITQIPGNKTLASVRRADSGGTISISGNKKIKTLEAEFDKVFGLYCQVCYYRENGKGFYTTGSADEMTLSVLNSYGEKNGFLRGKVR